MYTLKFDTGYEIMQDVLNNAEERGITDPQFNPIVYSIKHNMSDFEPLPRLTHLQLAFEDQPYYGRQLRFYNQAPWWYRLKFTVPADAPEHAVIRIGAADYYADVWLNGTKLGSHEGYFKSFEFPAAGLERDGENILLIKVSSPWDKEICLGEKDPRCLRVARRMIKGTYEHADSFGSRDLNPVGLWKPVEIDFYPSDRIADVTVNTELCGKTSGRIKASVRLDRNPARIRMRVYEKRTAKLIYEECGGGEFDVKLENIAPWTSYERGFPMSYRADFDLIENGKSVQTVSKTIGFKKIEIIRTAEKTELILNGEKFFVRGTSYLPEFYVSNVDVQRLKRDLYDMISLGMNMVRVHVHVQIPEFYELCDEMGLLVMQDSDLNWTFDDSDEFLPHVLDVWGQMLEMLGHHPCVALWGAINEPNNILADRYLNVLPGPQMAQMAERMTPGIPVIRGSGTINDLNTGDSHNYTGSLAGQTSHYLDGNYRSAEKFNTEFGIDCPPVYNNLIKMPSLVKKLNLTQARWLEISNYQYRLLKYFIEDYRIRKYNKAAGYMQFLFCDPLPQTFYGLVDFWGTPKPAYDAVMESNQKYCAIFEHDTESKALWAVNDTLNSVFAVLCASVTDKEGNAVADETHRFVLGADSAVRVCDFTMVTEDCRVVLTLKDEEGGILAMNHYDNPLSHPAHPQGHPFNIDCETGMPLYRN